MKLKTENSSEATPEVFAFEGFCNRVNALASARLRWPDGFFMRWMTNSHCPVPYHEIFAPKEGIDSTNEQSAHWKVDPIYRDDDLQLCYYFLSAAGASREDVASIYRQILDDCLFSPEVEPGRRIGFHYRRHIHWERASARTCEEKVIRLAERTGASEVLISSDHSPSALAIHDRLASHGLKPIILGRESGSHHDLDRPEGKVKEFISAWRSLSECPWSVSNAIASTVLDASRALGNEVWTFGDTTQRKENRCALFTRFGSDSLVADKFNIPKQITSGEGGYFSGECGKRIISFCLYGNREIYTLGMLRNLELARKYYPGWTVAIIHDLSVDLGLLERLRQGGAKLFHLDLKIPIMSQRMIPISDPTVERVIIRDADSSIGPREVAAVDAWIKSGKPLHSMRDHPDHSKPIMGGMWGCVGGTLPNLISDLLAAEVSGNFAEDQDFLWQYVWEPYKDSVLVHDSNDWRHPTNFPFPTARNDFFFVGQKIAPGGRALDDSHLRLQDLPIMTPIHPIILILCREPSARTANLTHLLLNHGEVVVVSHKKSEMTFTSTDSRMEGFSHLCHWKSETDDRTAWDHAFQFLTTNDNQPVWIVEDDVAGDPASWEKLFAATNFNQCDLLALDIRHPFDDPTWPHWHYAEAHFKEPRCSFNPLCRLSPPLIRSILDFREKTGQFIFLEALFASIAHREGMSMSDLRLDPATKNLFRNFRWRPEVTETSPGIHHPVKDDARHTLLC